MSSTESPEDDDVVLEAADADLAVTAWDPWTDPGVHLAVIGTESHAPHVIFAADTLHDMMGHGSDCTDREVGGVLLGQRTHTPRGDVTRVVDIVIADSQEASLTHVTFTHDAWQRIHAAVDQRDDAAGIVGWYHTHPGFGPFLSAHDRFIHENFFAEPWHVALVLDPVQCLVAVFAWQNGVLERLPGCLLYDDTAGPQELQALASRFGYAGEAAPRAKGLLSWLRR